jgi:hypothetical protein
VAAWAPFTSRGGGLGELVAAHRQHSAATWAINRRAGRAGGLGQQRPEPLNPPVYRDMVDLDPALGEELFDITVGQPEAEIPADRQHNHIGWGTEAAKGGSRDWRG